jgi:hypothetical protein
MVVSLIENKKGSEIIYPVVIFIVLNLVFSISIMSFVFKSSNGALVYEQSHAKEIFLILNQAKPDMKLSIDFSDALRIAKSNEYSGEIVNIKYNEILVKLSDRGGYRMSYYGDYDVSYGFKEDKLIINIGEKDE